MLTRACFSKYRNLRQGNRQWWIQRRDYALRPRGQPVSFENSKRTDLREQRAYVPHFSLYSGANAGLDKARAFLEPIKKQFPQITYSDLWVSPSACKSMESACLTETHFLQTLAGVCAIQEMGGPVIPWRAGRKDGDVENCTPDGRLPDA